MNQRRGLEHLAMSSLTEEKCPEAEQLAAYALGLLEGIEQLQVAAHVRDCPICLHDLALCRPPVSRRRPVLAILMPLPFAEGRRGAGPEQIRRYIAADLTVDVTIAPPDGDYWRVTGQAIRGGTGVSECIATMRSGRRRYEQISDGHGFFTFEALPSGRYTLAVADQHIHVQIRELLLEHEE